MRALAEIGSKDAAQQMRGIWIIESAELDAISRAEVSRIKAFLTRTTDRYRPPYERYIVTDWREEQVERQIPLTDVSVGEILEGALGIEPARWTKADQMRVGAYLKTRLWERYQARTGAVREWRYRHPSVNR